MFIFKKLRINSTNIFSYISYALGEVILLVIGISIAIYFDNYNHQNREDKKLNNIYELIAKEIESDTTNIGITLREYEKKLPFYTKVLTEKVTREEIDTSLQFKFLVLNYRPVKTLEKGYNLLSNNAKFKLGFNDSLNVAITNYYSTIADLDDVYINIVKDDILNNMNYWKKTYDWYYNLENNPAYVDYILNDKEYLNIVSHHSTLVYGNYVSNLQLAKTQAKELLVQLKTR